MNIYYLFFSVRQENISLETEVGEVKPPVSASDDGKNNAAAIKPAETSTQPTEKGVTNKAMDYEVAMTSPTELLAPEVFPDDITDMNGNAMSDKHRSRVDFHGQERSRTRCLLWVLIFFIVTSLIMTALFTLKMVEPDDSDDADPITVCLSKIKQKSQMISRHLTIRISS